jgi:RES domain-containing protein
MIVFRMHRMGRPVFDTTGSFLYPGRWHALARILVPDSIAIETASWVDMPGSQRFGDAWAAEKRSAVLRVPSAAINRMESNFVLNPAHEDFAQIVHEGSEEFPFDPRFFLEGQVFSA